MIRTLLLLAACGGAFSTSTSHLALETWLEDHPKDGHGVLIEQLRAPTGVEAELAEPLVEGLTFREDGAPRVEVLGDETWVTRRFRFEGPAGIYEVPPVSATWKDAEGKAQRVESVPLWIDLDVDAPRPAALEDPSDPSRVFGLPPAWVIASVGTLLVALGAGFVTVVVLLLRRRKRPGKAPPRPPDLVALDAWEAVRKDKNLDDYAKAVAISRIYREYTEAVLRFPATAWTTSEILEHLGAMRHLESGNVPRAKRLLRATDRVKFAEVAAGVDLFDELDADLRAFVRSTAPHVWEAA